MKKPILAAGCAVLLFQVCGLRAEDFDFSQENWIGSFQAAEAAQADMKFEPPTPSKIDEISAPEDYDAEMANKLAKAAAKGNLGYFSHRCYEYVTYHMQNAGVIKPAQWGQLGIGSARAVNFAQWAVKNPQTMRKELKLARIPTPSDTAEIPLGSIIVYGRGICGFSPTSGHIEVLVRPNRACSDGCETLTQSCFKNAAQREYIYVIVPVKS
ncbi:MAG: hypothetical protein NTX59_09280 [Elusimicrobia bacterium]|nr:hypothetical protein [Elusimicrobiota bacterium]